MWHGFVSQQPTVAFQKGIHGKVSKLGGLTKSKRRQECSLNKLDTLNCDALLLIRICTTARVQESLYVTMMLPACPSSGADILSHVETLAI
jgi:hypothetical protein